MSTLGTILKDNWEWRSQIWRIALFELRKRARGAVLGWAWYFIKPATYIICFWFALDVGLRVGGGAAEGAPPYILWLCSGIIPWFFIQDMLNAGVDVIHRYPYLVNKIRFPLSGISSIYATGTMIVQLMLQVPLFIIYFLCGMSFDVYLLQVPILLILMFIFWDMFSILMSPLSAVSGDVKNLMQALGTVFFWLSGVIFDAKAIPIPAVKAFMYSNPITFFVTAFRDAFYDKIWFWQDWKMCVGFAITFVITLACTLFVYKRLSEEVPDVL